MQRIELLAPAGDMEKLKTALHFGADAVYFAGKNYGLRAFSSNFEEDTIKEAVAYCHNRGKRCYVTLNVFARDRDFDKLPDYLKKLEEANVDAVIVSDLGIFAYVKKFAPSLEVHISTQASTTNKYAVASYKELGASRVVLARELSAEEIKKISEFNPDTELEVFVHGAMCISHSGRCLLSNYLTGRDANHGECVQACRWHYTITEDSRPDKPMEIQEDERGAYILNSKDMCLIEHLDLLADCGVHSFKIEGRMKSSYYVATVVNAYRKALDYLYECKEKGKAYKCPKHLREELNKASHRDYTTGFVTSDGEVKQKYDSNAQKQESIFVGIIEKIDEGRILVEQRNKFVKGDTLELLSPAARHGEKIKVTRMEDQDGNEVQVANQVQQKLWIYMKSTEHIYVGDILRL